MEGKIIVHHPIIAGLTRYNPLWAAVNLYQNVCPHWLIFIYCSLSMCIRTVNLLWRVVGDWYLTTWNSKYLNFDFQKFVCLLFVKRGSYSTILWESVRGQLDGRNSKIHKLKLTNTLALLRQWARWWFLSSVSVGLSVYVCLINLFIFVIDFSA